MWNFKCRLLWNILALHPLFRIFPIHCIIFEITSIAKLSKKRNIYNEAFWKRIHTSHQHRESSILVHGHRRNPELTRLTLSFNTFSRTATSLKTCQCQSHNSRKQKLLRIAMLWMQNTLTWSPLHLKEVQIWKYTVPLWIKTWLSCWTISNVASFKTLPSAVFTNCILSYLKFFKLTNGTNYSF